MIDITLETESGYFNYRVGAIIINNGNLLMIKNDNNPYYYSVGGRVQFGETSEATVLREAFEETQIEFEIERLAFVHENLFFADFKGNSRFHEIAFFYLMKQNDRIGSIKCESTSADGAKEHLHWLPINQLPQYLIYPEFFKTELTQLKSGAGHFLTQDEKTFRLK